MYRSSIFNLFDLSSPFLSGGYSEGPKQVSVSRDGHEEGTKKSLYVHIIFMKNNLEL